MAIGTGKGGRYRYYKCHAKINRGARACSCPNIPTDKLDELVMGEVAAQIFSKENLQPLLQKLLDTSDSARKRKNDELVQCESRLTDARQKLSNLHDAIENGDMVRRDPDVSRRLKNRRQEIDELNKTVKLLRQQLGNGPSKITSGAINRFAKIMQKQLMHGEGEARRQLAQAFISEVRVGKNIEINGDTSALEHGVASVARSKGKVPIFDREWCPWPDSNGHSLRNSILSRARLPIPPQGLFGCVD